MTRSKAYVPKRPSRAAKRDLALAFFILPLLLAAFRRPWLGLMSPHRYMYGFAVSFPWALITVVVFFVSLFHTKVRCKVLAGAPMVWRLAFVVRPGRRHHTGFIGGFYAYEGMDLLLDALPALFQARLLVASDVGGHKELIRHNQTGVMFKADDVPALVVGVQDLLAARECWPESRAAGRRFVELERNWQASAAHYAAPFAALRHSPGATAHA